MQPSALGWQIAGDFILQAAERERRQAVDWPENTAIKFRHVGGVRRSIALLELLQAIQCAGRKLVHDRPKIHGAVFDRRSCQSDPEV